MSELEDHLYQKVSQEIRSWEPLEAHEVYVIALHIAFVDDDMRQGMLCGPCYNTLRHWQTQSPLEEKWIASYEFGAGLCLCQPVVEEWGNQDIADPIGVELRNKHLADLTLLITEEEHDRFWKHLYCKKGSSGRPGFPLFTPEDAEEYDQFREKLSRNGEAFVDVCAAVVHRLQSDGPVRQVCGRIVPVVLDVSNDMDDLKVRAWRLTRQVNPGGVAEDWVKTHLGRYRLSE